jgi:hypothetical protein
MRIKKIIAAMLCTVLATELFSTAIFADESGLEAVTIEEKTQETESVKSFAGKPVYYDGWSDQFRVTVTWEVLNDHQDEGNYFGVYYYMPGNCCYYKANTGQYSFVEYKSKATKEKGTRTYTFNMQGPPCKLTMSVYGSAMDNTQYYITKVEIEPIHPRPGTGLPTKFTLWEGKFGCSVATMFTNTIACDLFLDRGKPEFSNWYDPYTNREAVFGDDKVNETYSYYDRGCREPYIYCKDSDGNFCDAYGAAWPSYEPKLSAKSGRKVVINWKNFRNHVKTVFPEAKYVEVQYGTEEDLNNAETKKFALENLEKKTAIRKLKPKETYYFRARLCGEEEPLTDWSDKKKIETKK